MLLRSLLIVATPYQQVKGFVCIRPAHTHSLIVCIRSGHTHSLIVCIRLIVATPYQQVKGFVCIRPGSQGHYVYLL